MMNLNLRSGPRTLLPKGELDFSLPPAERPNKRTCISNACMPCRKRKSKCDGNRPACAACANVYDTECYYDLDADHRRKGALKRDIKELRGTLQNARAIVGAIKNSSDADVDELIHLIRQHPDESEEAILQEFYNQRHGEIPADAYSIAERALSVNHSGKAPPSSNKDWGSPHYGHTSHFPLIEDDESITKIVEQKFEKWTSVTDDLSLLNHLMAVYFTWSHPWYLLFSEELFFHGLKDKRYKYCTPLLVNAILALGCLFSDRPEACKDQNDPATVGDHFFAEAERLYHEDRDRSSLTMIQALGLMSIRQAMKNHESSGRTYVAIMMSKVIELGLHNSYAAQPNGLLTESEIQARRFTFWGCFVLENLWAICIGRVTTLPRLAIMLEKPVLADSLEAKPWQPHGLPDPTPEVFTKLQQAGHKYGIQLQLSLLCEILDGIIYMFYAPSARVTHSKLQCYHTKLQGWYDNLPAELHIRREGPTLPQVITLHMFYHNCVIQLFKPFMMVHFIQLTTSPRQICTDAANDISSLLKQYDETYGLRRMFFINTHSIMAAAIIHLVNIASPKPSIVRTAYAESYLAEAMRGLGQMTEGIAVAARYLKGIKGLILKWCNNEHPVPAKVREAMNEVPIGTPTTTDSLNSPNKSPKKLTPNGGLERKESAPELLQTMPNTEQSNVPQQQYWTPFNQSSSNFQGVPYLPPDDVTLMDPNNDMDIMNVLTDSWNRDGFHPNQDDRGPMWGGGSFEFERGMLE